MKALWNMKLILNHTKTILCRKSNYHVLKLSLLPTGCPSVLQLLIIVYMKKVAEESSKSILFSQSCTHCLHEAPTLLQGFQYTQHILLSSSDSPKCRIAVLQAVLRSWTWGEAVHRYRGTHHLPAIKYSTSERKIKVSKQFLSSRPELFKTNRDFFGYRLNRRTLFTLFLAGWEAYGRAECKSSGRKVKHRGLLCLWRASVVSCGSGFREDGSFVLLKCTCYRSWTILNWAPLEASHSHVLPLLPAMAISKASPLNHYPVLCGHSMFLLKNWSRPSGPSYHRDNSSLLAMSEGGIWCMVSTEPCGLCWSRICTLIEIPENLLSVKTWAQTSSRCPVFIHRVFYQCPLCSSYLLNETVFVNVQAVVVSMNTWQKFPYKPPVPPAAPGPTPLMTSKVQRVWDQVCGDNTTAIIICFESGLVMHSHLAVAAHWFGNSWVFFTHPLTQTVCLHLFRDLPPKLMAVPNVV